MNKEEILEYIDKLFNGPSLCHNCYHHRTRIYGKNGKMYKRIRHFCTAENRIDQPEEINRKIWSCEYHENEIPF